MNRVWLKFPTILIFKWVIIYVVSWSIDCIFIYSTIRSINVYGDEEAETTKGAKLGWTKDQVKKAYPAVEGEDDILGTRDEDARVGLYFSIKQGKVAGIMLAELPE